MNDTTKRAIGQIKGSLEYFLQFQERPGSTLCASVRTDDLTALLTHLDGETQRADQAEKEKVKLQAFKDWTHAYLDAHGVPHHPPGTHGAEGCRIGDRMDWLTARLAAAEARVWELEIVVKDLLPLLEHAERCEANADDGLGHNLRSLRRRLDTARRLLAPPRTQGDKP